MRVLFKYIFWLLSLFSLVIYYFLGTTLGHVNIGFFVEDYYTQKMENKIEILSLNIEKYPTIVAEVKINDEALLSLNGIVNEADMNLSYYLRGDTFKWDDYVVTSPAWVKGKMKGKFSELFISGRGEIFDGNISYLFTRKPSRLENTQLTLQGVDSKRLLDFLKYKNILAGKIDVRMDFEYFTSYRRKGLVKVHMQKGIFPKVSEELEVRLDAELEVKDLLHEFVADIHSSIGKLRVANGHYNRAANITSFDYGLQINELLYLEKFLGHKYGGKLTTAGKLKYEMGELSLLGDSTSYGGLLEYNYKDDYLNMVFTRVSLEKLLRQLSYPALLSSKIYGTASYDLKDDIILLNTKLKETRFRRTQMTDKIYELTDIDILKDTYNNSVFTAGYQDFVLTSFLQIDNGINHLYLRNTRMSSKTNEITADFEVAIDGQEFLGEVYGTLKDPKVKVDMSKLIKYQINKKIENFFGTGKALNKKNIKEKLDELESKEIKYKKRTFLEGFFD